MAGPWVRFSIASAELFLGEPRSQRILRQVDSRRDAARGGRARTECLKRVLVVDDERSIRVTRGEFLRDDGDEVSVAESLEQAWEMLAIESFDGVLTDIIMPQFSGVALLKAIKETSLQAQVILMTGEPTVETAAEATRSGAFDYLVKPFSKTLLLETIANAIHRRQDAEAQGSNIDFPTAQADSSSSMIRTVPLPRQPSAAQSLLPSAEADASHDFLSTTIPARGRPATETAMIVGLSWNPEHAVWPFFSSGAGPSRLTESLPRPMPKWRAWTKNSTFHSLALRAGSRGGKSREPGDQSSAYTS